MKQLISMTDFLPEHPYSKFLKQLLEQWMFDKNDKRCLFNNVNKIQASIILQNNIIVENTIHFNLELTPTAIKQLGL